MAYTKRTWLGRQGTGLNKFSIGGATPVTIVNQPDSVTQVGDALSAGNLNDLEDRIEDAFDDVDTALDTKADEQDVTNLNNALTAIDHRVQNLEQAKGDYEVKPYKDGSITPSGKGNWAVVEGLRGVSRVENQMVTNPSFATETDWIFGNCNHAVSDNILTMTATALRGYAESFVDMQNGHIYLFSAKVKLTTGNTSVRVGVLKSSGNAWANFRYTENTTNWQTISILFELTGNEGNCFVIVRDERESGWDAIQFADVLLKDVTLYFNGTIPSDADTIAEIQTNYPHLLTPSEYGVRIVDSSYSGVKGYGIAFENKTIRDTDGEEISSSARVCTSFIAVTPSSSVNIKLVWYNSLQEILTVATYDSNKGFINTIGLASKDATVNLTSSMHYIRVVCRYSDNSNTSPADWINKLYINDIVYQGVLLDTLSLTYSGKSAGSVYDSCEPNVEVNGVAKRRETQRIASVDLSTLTWNYNSGWNCWQGTVPSDIALPSSTTVVVNALWAGMIAVRSSGFTTQSNVGTFAINPNGIFFVNNGSTTVPPSGTMQYELATPVETLSDPLIDNTLLTEAYGRMSTVQTGTVVDGSFDMGFITL